MVRAVYPGTFDPLTRGHEDIIRRGASLFDSVVVGVAASRGKNPIFSVDERIEIAREALADCANVRITSFSGLLVNFLREHDARVVLRGVRSVSDFDYEFQMAGMNRQMMADCETLFMVPTEGQMFVSGTLVREIAMMGGDVSRFVAPPVLAWIQRKLASPRRAPAG
ncbi:MAG: pantetheine-phosphate adenylyltransferase [Betaproteobacteria bacterium]|nr:pantetheine-phosphate adenylyltransferase [Betaproteobacteria bacterium]